MRALLGAGFVVVATFASANAPLQCGHGGADAKHEEDAGDALYALAMDFRAKGNEDAAKQTLRYLVDKFPSNRHVPEAREELEGSAAKSDGGS